MLQLDNDTLNLDDTPKIVFMRVEDAMQLVWGRNPKLHDIGAISQSIQRYGFQELPKYDSSLKAIVAGNGRVEALRWLEVQKQERPRGVAQVSETGEWAIPILFGVDQQSMEQAIAYAIDSNNLTMAGGDFTAFDFKRLWDASSYITLLEQLNVTSEMPVTVTGDDLDLFSGGLDYHVDEVQGEDKEIGAVTTFKVTVGDVMYLEDIVRETRAFYDTHPEWRCAIAT